MCYNISIQWVQCIYQNRPGKIIVEYIWEIGKTIEQYEQHDVSIYSCYVYRCVLIYDYICFWNVQRRKKFWKHSEESRLEKGGRKKGLKLHFLLEYLTNIY